jgi:Sulfotransferase domain
LSPIRASIADQKPKVLGLGLSKTGTKSLQQALVSLGYSNHSWSPELHERWYHGDVAAVVAIVDAHDCVEDWPFLAVYEELMDRYGTSARYVLTVRKSPEIWLDSVISHADRIGPQYDAHRRMAFGYDHPRGHQAEYLAYYSRHNAGVRAAIQARGLSHCFKELCWETGDGWTELCELIEQAPPKAPFPHRNRRPMR